MKGVVLGGLVGFGLDRAGLHGPIPELIARLGPGALESSAIAHEVVGKEKTNGDKKEESGRLDERVLSFTRELGNDAIKIGKRVPHGIYSAVNLGGWVDKARGRTLDTNHATNTEVWSDAQESGPYRGILGLAILKFADQYVRPIAESSSTVAGTSYKAFYNALESLGVFWVNTGNNVQGAVAVYKEIKQSAKGRLDAAKKTVADPFQLANIIVCTAWYGTEVALRSNGIRMEEYLGNFGAGLESALLSCDTAVAAQVAKPIAYAQLIIPARMSVRDKNLTILANQHGSPYFARTS